MVVAIEAEVMMGFKLAGNAAGGGKGKAEAPPAWLKRSLANGEVTASPLGFLRQSPSATAHARSDDGDPVSPGVIIGFLNHGGVPPSIAPAAPPAAAGGGGGGAAGGAGAAAAAAAAGAGPVAAAYASARAPLVRTSVPTVVKLPCPLVAALFGVLMHGPYHGRTALSASLVGILPAVQGFLVAARTNLAAYRLASIAEAFANAKVAQPADCNPKDTLEQVMSVLADSVEAAKGKEAPDAAVAYVEGATSIKQTKCARQLRGHLHTILKQLLPEAAKADLHESVVYKTAPATIELLLGVVTVEMAGLLLLATAGGVVAASVQDALLPIAADISRLANHLRARDAAAAGNPATLAALEAARVYTRELHDAAVDLYHAATIVAVLATPTGGGGAEPGIDAEEAARRVGAHPLQPLFNTAVQRAGLPPWLSVTAQPYDAVQPAMAAATRRLTDSEQRRMTTAAYLLLDAERATDTGVALQLCDDVAGKAPWIASAYLLRADRQLKVVTDVQAAEATTVAQRAALKTAASDADKKYHDANAARIAATAAVAEKEAAAKAAADAAAAPGAPADAAAKSTAAAAAVKTAADAAKVATDAETAATAAQRTARAACADLMELPYGAGMAALADVDTYLTLRSFGMEQSALELRAAAIKAAAAEWKNREHFNARSVPAKDAEVAERHRYIAYLYFDPRVPVMQRTGRP